MARFSANITDSSEDEDDHTQNTPPPPEPLSLTKHNGRITTPSSEDNSEEEDTEQDSLSEFQSSSSEMDEDELFNSPPKKRPPRNAMVGDEDVEFQDAHKHNDRPGGLVVSAKVPPPRQRGDPTLIPRAQQLGVDAQKMHVMQTSLFRMPEEAAAMKAISFSKPASLPTTTAKRLALRPHMLNRKHSRDSEGDGMRLDSRERASFAHDIEPSPYHPWRKYARVESSALTITGCEGAFVDAGLSMGRSFRVGWGPGGMLVHLGKLCSPFTSIKTSANSSIINITSLPIYSNQDEDESNRLVKLLSHHLANTPINFDVDNIPFANPSPTLRFSSFSSLYAAGNKSFEAAIYRLGHALFDDIDLKLKVGGVTPDIQNRIMSVRRKAALSVWLEEAVAHSVDISLKSNPSANSAFTLLTGNQIEKACEAAIDAGNPKLATLISQAGGDFEFREDLKEQLEIWRDERVDVHIDEEIRKIYALLAGVLDVVEGSRGTGLEKCKDVDIFEGLDWKRAFGIHLWFVQPLDASIAQVFESYDQQRRESAERIAGPRTWYSEHPSYPSNLMHVWNLPPTRSTPDALFSLIKLHADPTCSLSDVLCPLSFGPSPLDYSLSWHLYIILSRCMRVRDFSDRGDAGVQSLSQENEEDGDGVEGHSPSADLLASLYALQLEKMGLLQEAVFVLLHIEGSLGREKAVKDLLARQAAKLDDWTIRGLCGSLKVPTSWVNEAKAIHALDTGEMYQAYELYLTAHLYNPAHDIAVLALAPDVIIRKDLELLKDIFERFKTEQVDNWNLRGKTFLDYAHIMTRLPELHAQITETDAVPDASQAAELDELARSVPKLIEILPNVLRNGDGDPRHNAALAEMIGGLMFRLDRVKPLALSQSQVKLILVDDATKLRHIHSTAHERFMKTIQVA